MGYSAHNRNLEGGEREREIENVLEEIMAENLNRKKKKRYPDTGNKEGPKQDKP